jgi:exportin-2 (importin alpha re-exporter)
VVDIPEYYQDNLQTWMGGFFKLLLQPPEFPQTLKNLTCENLALYADKYQEVFEPYVTEAVTCVWTTLLGLNGDDDNKNDAIISSGIKFLSSAANTRWSNSPFENQEALRHIVEKLIIPNIQLRDADVELFTDNPDDFIRKDLENADAETRRRSAVDLVRALSKFYEAKVTPILLEYVSKLFSSNRHLRSKDAGVQLVIAMAAKGETRAQGVSVVNDKIDINEFFKSQVVLTDELSGLVGVALDEDKAVLKSSCLKFLILFRNKLDRNLVIESLVKIISNFTNLTTTTVLNSSSKVLVSYAAHCAYLLLGIVSEGDLALPNEDIAIENALSLIFASKEQNEYLIKLVFKLLKKKSTRQTRTISADEKSSVLKKLISLMEGFSSNPVNAVFTHFLFESIGESLPLSQDKTSLINPLCQILERNVTEYIPYALQVLALLIESPSSSPVEVFTHLFPLLLNESLWKNPSLIPGLARILAAYVFVPAYAPLVLANLVHVTERFKILLNSNKFEQTAFDIANCIVVNPHLGIIPNEFLKVIFLAVLTKIHLKRSEKLLKQFSILLACAIANSPHAEQLIAVIESIQPGIASQVVKDLWMNSVATLNINLLTPKLRKLFFLSLPKLLNTQFIQSNPVLMQSVLSACETMICVNPSKAVAEAGFAPAAAQDTANAEDAHEFEVSYSKLGSTLNLVTENDFLPHVTGDGLAAFKHALRSLPSGALQASPSLANWASS